MKLLVGAMMVTLALAGCVDDDTYVPDEADACVVTAADDFDSCTAEEQGLTRNEVAHRHDYWQGQDRITVLDLELESERYGAGQISWCAGWPWYELNPADGFTVIQGTSQVEITMDWGDEAYDQFSSPELWVKTAAMDAPEYFADATPGETIVFEVTDNADNDLPHSLISAWEFVWYIHPEDDGTDRCDVWHWSEFSIQVDIVKGLDIPLFPGHPDFWDNGTITEMEVINEVRHVAYSRGDETNVGGGMCLDGDNSTDYTNGGSCLWDPFLLQDGLIVPYDTEYVTITADVTSEYPGRTVGLAFHGADTRELTFVEPTQTDGTTQIYEIDVERIQNDGPYNLQSLWELWMYPTSEDDPATGDGHFHGTIEFTMTVHKESA